MQLSSVTVQLIVHVPRDMKKTFEPEIRISARNIWLAGNNSPMRKVGLYVNETP